VTVLCSEPITIYLLVDDSVVLDLCTHHVDESPCPQHPVEGEEAL